MLVPVRFHIIHDWVCFALGYLFNGTLLWLITFRTVKKGHQYRPIFLLSTMIDLLYLAVYVVVVPVMRADRGIGVFVSVGPLGWLPQPYNFALMATWMFFCMLSLYSLCVPFVYRYLVLCQQMTYGVDKFLAILTIPVVLSLGNVGTIFWSGYAGSEEQQQRGRDMFLRNESSPITSGGRNMVIAYVSVDLPHSKVNLIYMMSMSAINYALVFICGWRIYRQLKAEMKNMSADQALTLNKHVNQALFLQSLVPLVVGTLPNFVMQMGVLLGLRIGDITLYKTALLAWTPVVNPLITIWVVRDYRREICKWVKWGEVVGPTTEAVVALSRQQQQLQLQPT